MRGSTGPIVRLHTPSVSRCIVCGTTSHSSKSSSTRSACGARRRNVIVRSSCTSGENFGPAGFHHPSVEKVIPCPLRMAHGILGLCPDAACRQQQTADNACYSFHTKVPCGAGSEVQLCIPAVVLYGLWSGRDHESLATISTIFPSGVRKAALGATSACSVICAR